MVQKSDIIIQSLLLELHIKPALGLRVRRERDTTTREEALQGQDEAHTDTEISRGITSTVWALMLCFYTRLYLSQVCSEDITQVRGTFKMKGFRIHLNTMLTPVNERRWCLEPMTWSIWPLTSGAGGGGKEGWELRVSESQALAIKWQKRYNFH